MPRRSSWWCIGLGRGFELTVGVVPDARRLLDLALAGGVLLHEVEDREVVELHRRVVPEGEQVVRPRRGCRPARPHRPDGRPMTGRACPTNGPASRRTSPRRPGACPLQRPVCAKPRGVEHDPAVAAEEVARLEVRRHRPVPRQVGLDVPLVRLDDHAQPLESLEDLTRIGPTEVSIRSTSSFDGAHHPVTVAAARPRRRRPASRGSGTGRCPTTQNSSSDDRVQVEVVAVVEVAVGGRGVTDRLGDLVDREVVGRGEPGGRLIGGERCRRSDVPSWRLMTSETSQSSRATAGSRQATRRSRSDVDLVVGHAERPHVVDGRAVPLGDAVEEPGHRLGRAGQEDGGLVGHRVGDVGVHASGPTRPGVPSPRRCGGSRRRSGRRPRPGWPGTAATTPVRSFPAEQWKTAGQASGSAVASSRSTAAIAVGADARRHLEVPIDQVVDGMCLVRSVVRATAPR